MPGGQPPDRPPSPTPPYGRAAFGAPRRRAVVSPSSTMCGRRARRLAGPMPSMPVNSSTDRKSPRLSRASMMARARAGPTPGSSCNSTAEARLTFTTPASGECAAGASAAPATTANPKANRKPRSPIPIRQRFLTYRSCMTTSLHRDRVIERRRGIRRRLFRAGPTRNPSRPTLYACRLSLGLLGSPISGHREGSGAQKRFPGFPLGESRQGLMAAVDMVTGPAQGVFHAMMDRHQLRDR